MIIYDCEIKKAIQPKDEPKDPSQEYCQGWDDFAGMGISVICAYDCSTKAYRVFMDDNLDDFQTMIDNSNIVLGWNNHRFDDPLIKAHGLHLPPEKSYDLKAAIMRSAGLDPDKGQDHKTMSLGAMAKLNTLSMGKTGHGSAAPALYQRARYGELIDYCLNDVRLTKMIIDRARSVGFVRLPDSKHYEVILPEAAI